MNRNEQKFYHDVNRIADSLESIAKSLQTPKMPFGDGSFFSTSDSDSYNDSSESVRSTLKDLIDENPFTPEEKMLGSNFLKKNFTF